MQTSQVNPAPAAPISATADSNQACRHVRSKLVFRACCDACLIGDEEEAERLLSLWRRLIRREGGDSL